MPSVFDEGRAVLTLRRAPYNPKAMDQYYAETISRERVSATLMLGLGGALRRAPGSGQRIEAVMRSTTHINEPRQVLRSTASAGDT